MIQALLQYFIQERTSAEQKLYLPTQAHKEYKRFPSIHLVRPVLPPTDLGVLLQTRTSSRSLGAGQISQTALSTLLLWSVGSRQQGENASRPYPSGGARYAVELYFCALKDGEIPQGAYHYNAAQHTLTKLPFADITQLSIAFSGPNAFARSANALLFFSFIKSKSMAQYGALASKLAFIEAGHMCQNVQLVATALALKSCPLGTNDPQRINQVLQLDGVNESVFYTLALSV